MRIAEIDWKLLDTPRKLLLQRLLINTTEVYSVELERDPCWVWQGAHAGSGMPHATITVEGKSRQIGLNRVAWHIFHGMPLKGSKSIQIRKNEEACDQSMCWNPDHYDAVETDTE
jgi:hypothetical protein